MEVKIDLVIGSGCSTATNQTKGGYESAAKKLKGASAAQKEEYIKKQLIGGLKANAKMTPAQVAEVKAKGAAAVTAKAEGAAKTPEDASGYVSC